MLTSLSVQKIKRLRKLYKDDDERCPMLLKDRCVIYLARPIICRTAGLPILYREAERAFVDYCRLNFTLLPENYEFDNKNILDTNPFYTELIQIEKKFSKHILGEMWRPTHRQSLKGILFNMKLKHKKS